jgi:hypothetical protein
MNARARRTFSLTPAFGPVVIGLDERKPFKRLSPFPYAETRLKPGVNQK